MILYILQARTSSTRLPNKVLLPILKKPMLLRQIDRIKRSRYLDKLVVATSTHPSDAPIASLCKINNIAYFRGSLNDVLDRFYQTARIYNPEHIVRLTGDCPLIDPLIIDQTIKHYLSENFDYSSNAYEPTFPDGLNVEIFTFKTLETTWKNTKLPSEREHVTPFMRKVQTNFKLGTFKNNTDQSHFRWTVDHKEDFELITKIYESLYPQNSHFTSNDIYTFLKKNPELLTMNSKYKRNEAYKKSLEKEEHTS